MEKEIVWTKVAQKDFWEVVAYLNEMWPHQVFENFSSSLDLKVKLIARQPDIGFKSSKHSSFRKTLITKHYMLIYSVKRSHIVIHRIKHTAMKK